MNWTSIINYASLNIKIILTRFTQMAHLKNIPISNHITKTLEHETVGKPEEKSILFFFLESQLTPEEARTL